METKDNEWGLPGEWRDAVHITNSVTIGWWDRVRVLFGWMPIVKTRTLAAVPLGLLLTDQSSVHLAAPEWWRFIFRRKHMGYFVEASPPPAANDEPQVSAAEPPLKAVEIPAIPDSKG